MAGSPKKRERKARAQSLLGDQMSLDALCGRVASGETLIEICRELNVDYSTVNTWIQANDDRRQRYSSALTVRESHNKDRVISELLAMVNADITEAFNENGTLKPLELIPSNVRRWMAGLEIEELYEGSGKDKVNYGRVRKIKLWDKVRVVEMLAKHLRMLVDKHELEASDSLVDLLALSRKQPDV